MAGPTFMLGPMYLLSLKWSSRYGSISFWNTIHMKHSNSQNWLMLHFSPDRTILGTSISSLCIPCTVFHLIYDTNSRQSSKILFGALYFIFLPEPFFGSFISLSATFDHGVNGSVYLKWHDTSLSFMLNSLWIIFLALSHVIAHGTPSCWKS